MAEYWLNPSYVNKQKRINVNLPALIRFQTSESTSVVAVLNKFEGESSASIAFSDGRKFVAFEAATKHAYSLASVTQYKISKRVALISKWFINTTDGEMSVFSLIGRFTQKNHKIEIQNSIYVHNSGSITVDETEMVHDSSLKKKVNETKKRDVKRKTPSSNKAVKRVADDDIEEEEPLTFRLTDAKCNWSRDNLQRYLRLYPHKAPKLLRITGKEKAHPIYAVDKLSCVFEHGSDGSEIEVLINLVLLRTISEYNPTIDQFYASQ